ncbi:histidine phosphatase family protein [Roseateles aquatilis]|uniref:histidine phosphatase family protein n=1 Tax=Roseateles aquatilis TaxID=431061 RepID=UPI001EDE6D81|nr:histidine phosphatase family protein [Roseateles aquatilis]
MHRFVLVRHAQADCNLLDDGAPLDASQADSPLTALGQRQAAALAAGLPEGWCEGPVFCSPMRRALDTATALARARGLALAIDPRLVEVAPTAASPTGLTQGDWDGFLTRRVAFPDRVLIPGVESLTAQFERVRSFLSELGERRSPSGGADATSEAVRPGATRAAHEAPSAGARATTLIVSHATTVELALLALLGLELDALRRFRFRLSNTGVHVVESEGLGAPARLLMVNGLAHLGRWI